jgi:threonyl-tRNA synthetase
MKKTSTPSLDHIRHTLSHILAHAVQDSFGNAKFGIGPTIDNGFYYDIELGRPLTNEELKPIEKRMKQLIASQMEMVSVDMNDPLVEAFLAKQPYKQELLKEIQDRNEVATFYRIGKFLDLCKGGHVKNSREIPADAFTLTHVAGAYWKGDEKRPMLQRIYGLAFSTKAELEAEIARQIEAKKRDHKILGPELDLFTFSELVGSGLPLWTPKGTLVRNLLNDFVWELRKAVGYEWVEIPHITKKDLYERSGHWDKFQNELFKVTTREGHVFAMKPMNCPHHTQIYARKQHSYRELPQRYANTTMCYRDEQSGELAGISRARAFTQDDAHVFCRVSQVEEEMTKIWKIVSRFYQAAGFTLDVRLSLHDPKHPEKYLGEPARWVAAEKQLRALVKKQGVKAVEAVGEAAFYGPKIDFLAKDSIGREWQVATIQLDMNLPERFDLTCVNEKGDHERIVMIHAAIMGSIERFMSILIEHTAGQFPLWLSPVQVQIIPVTTKHNASAKKLYKTLTEAGLRVHLDDANETVGYKIRKAEKQKAPYMIVIGDKEKALTKLSIRVRGKKNVKLVTLKTWIPLLQKAIVKRSIAL